MNIYPLILKFTYIIFIVYFLLYSFYVDLKYLYIRVQKVAREPTKSNPREIIVVAREPTRTTQGKFY